MLMESSRSLLCLWILRGHEATDAAMQWASCAGLLSRPLPIPAECDERERKTERAAVDGSAGGMDEAKDDGGNNDLVVSSPRTAQEESPERAAQRSPEPEFGASVAFDASALENRSSENLLSGKYESENLWDDWRTLPHPHLNDEHHDEEGGDEENGCDGDGHDGGLLMEEVGQGRSKITEKTSIMISFDEVIRCSSSSG